MEIKVTDVFVSIVVKKTKQKTMEIKVTDLSVFVFLVVKQEQQMGTKVLKHCPVWSLWFLTKRTNRKSELFYVLVSLANHRD